MAQILRPAERLVLNIINYREENNVTFHTSSFWNKNRFIEVIQYLRRDVSRKGEDEDRRKYKVKFANMFAMEDINEADFPIRSALLRKTHGSNSARLGNHPSSHRPRPGDELTESLREPSEHARKATVTIDIRHSLTAKRRPAAPIALSKVL